MILFDLQCPKKHQFEAWFRSNDSYEEQVASSAISCPTCGSGKVSKAPMAPRIAKSSGRKDEDPAPKAAAMAEIRRKLTEMRGQIEANCDYVGPEFAEQARRIHYGESEKRSIYGEATKAEAEALNEEGIEYGTVPWLPPEN